jgi:hypothetical protein
MDTVLTPLPASNFGGSEGFYYLCTTDGSNEFTPICKDTYMYDENNFLVPVETVQYEEIDKGMSNNEAEMICDVSNGHDLNISASDTNTNR